MRPRSAALRAPVPRSARGEFHDLYRKPPGGSRNGPLILAHSSRPGTFDFPHASRVSRRPIPPSAPSGDAPRRALEPCARGREPPFGGASGGETASRRTTHCPRFAAAHLPSRQDTGTEWRAAPGGAGSGRCAVRRRCPGLQRAVGLRYGGLAGNGGAKGTYRRYHDKTTPSGPPAITTSESALICSTLSPRAPGISTESMPPTR
jgi:hypothetical protein